MWRSVRGREDLVECLKVTRNLLVKKETLFIGKRSTRKKKNPEFPIWFESTSLCVQMFSYATFSARIIVLSGRNVGERALLYVQRCFTNKSYASEVVMSQEGNSWPQPQPDSPRAAQSAYRSHSDFLSNVSRLQDSCKCHPFSFTLPSLHSCFLHCGMQGKSRALLLVCAFIECIRYVADSEYVPLKTVT